MTGSSGAPAWARTWQPRTKNDARALQLYDDATISAIATGLPEGVDQVELTGLIRQWASQQIAMGRAPREASTDTAAHVRDGLRAAAVKCRKTATAPHKLREAAAALDRLPDVAKDWMASLRSADDGARLDNWCRNLGDILSAPRRFREAAMALDRLSGMRLDDDWHRRNQQVRSAQRLAEELAVVAEMAGDKVRKVKVDQGPDGDQLRLVKIAQGRRGDVQLRRAIRELGWIYETLTGARPARREDPCNGQNGPFEAFVKAAIKPLWPYASGPGYIRDAVDWCKNRN
jgi:hypothetical protein